MNHSFNVEIAQKYGLTSAVIIENLAFWIKHNQANNKHFYDGEYWTYNTTAAFAEIFPYLTKRQIEHELKKLEILQVIKTGNYNQLKFDRTKWYSIKCTFCKSLYFSIYRKCEMHLPKMSNAFTENVTAIPDINTVINTDSVVVGAFPQNDQKTAATPLKFPKVKNINLVECPPTKEEIEEYAKSINYFIDSVYFLKKYTANGWTMGNGNEIKDWRAVVDIWAKNEKTVAPTKPTARMKFRNEV